MFEHRQSQITHNPRSHESPQNGDAGNYNHPQTPFGTSSSNGLGAIEQSLFNKSEGFSTPDSNSSEDSSGTQTNTKSTKSYSTEEADDPGSVHFRGHSTNPQTGKIEGPLTASLSATGEVDDASTRGSAETEEALIGAHDDLLPRASIPPLKSPPPAAVAMGAEDNSSSQLRRKSYTGGDDTVPADSSNEGQLLGPMEPMKFSRPNRTWNPLRANSVQKLQALDPSEMCNGELPYIPGLPTHGPALPSPTATAPTHNGGSTNNANSFSDDSRLASIVNGKRFYRYRTNESGPPNVLGDKYSQRDGTPSLMLMSQSSVQNKPQEHYPVPSNGPVYPYNDFSEQLLSRNAIPSTANANGQPKFEKYAYSHYQQQHQKPSSGYVSGSPLMPLGPVGNGGSLSFIPPFRDDYTPAPHPVTTTTTAYPVLFSPVSVGAVPPGPVMGGTVPTVVPPHSFLPVNSHAPADHPSAASNIMLNTVQVDEKAAHPNTPLEDMDSTNTKGAAPANAQGRTFKCTHPGCDWSFVRSSDQKRHIRSHQKPSLKCPYWELVPNCNRKGAMFYRLDVLKRHLRLVHLQRPTNGATEGGICRICAEPFENSRDFIQHCGSCAKHALALKENADTTK